MSLRSLILILVQIYRAPSYQFIGLHVREFSFTSGSHSSCVISHLLFYLHLFSIYFHFIYVPNFCSLLQARNVVDLHWCPRTLLLDRIPHTPAFPAYVALKSWMLASWLHFSSQVLFAFYFWPGWVLRFFHLVSHDEIHSASDHYSGIAVGKDLGCVQHISFSLTDRLITACIGKEIWVLNIQVIKQT